MRELPFADREFDGVIAVQSIEHVPDPDRALAEAARILRPPGTAVFVTPNRLTFARPDEIIDPYHYVEYDPAQLRALCEGHFGAVALHGIFGSARYSELVAEQREGSTRCCGATRCGCGGCSRAGSASGSTTGAWQGAHGADPRAAAITAEDFELRDADLEAAYDLVAVCGNLGLAADPAGR